MIEVHLEPEELLLAETIGKRRWKSVVEWGLKDKHGMPNGDEAKQIYGASGEVAAAKAMNLFWPATVDKFKDPDIYPDIQVKTRTKHSYNLIVRDGDNPDYRFVLVTGLVPAKGLTTDFKVWGWCWGWEAKNEKYRDNPGGFEPAFFPPKSVLRPIVRCEFKEGAD